MVSQPRGQALTLHNIGMIYEEAGDFDHALQYFEQSADKYKFDKALLLTIAGNEAAALKERGDYAASISRYGYALDLARKLHSPIFQVRILALLADAQLSAGNDNAAQRSIEEGLRLSVSSDSIAWRPVLYTVAAKAALNRGDLSAAQILIEKALLSNSVSATPLVRDSERVAYEVYKKKGDRLKAFNHLERFKKLDDQIRTVTASANAALMSAQFDFANQRASIAQFKTTEVQNEATIAHNQRTILIILLVGSGIVITLLFIGYLSIRRSRNQVRAANAELSGTNVALERALSTRTQFLATTSHEIRTPLNGILGMTQVLLADRTIESEVKSKIELVHGAGETMRALVDDILDVAKMTTGELKLHPAEMDLHRLLRDTFQVWGEQARTKGIALTLNIEMAPQRIIADEVRLRQIVFNLTANAVKFTDRGEVRLVARAVPDADISGGERLRIDISDTGVGIPEDKLEEIFESFRQVDSATTRRHGGTGLGLAICKNLANIMGGDIAVSSILGVGATFTLDVPLDRVATAPIVRAEPGSRKLSDSRLLLVEANPLSQSILRAVLSPKVARFATAANADEALAAITAGEIDLLLLDANTLGRDLETVERLARPVTIAGGDTVLLWPSPDEIVNAAAMEKGITRLLATPLPAPELVAALTALYEPVHTPTEAAA